jgi:alkyl sulfatase BDS1-like metallo-beta-lactamase superfamily hydrolase
MRPFYDEPEFVVRNIWRLYGGWWDGDPAHLKPPPADQLARELAALAGGAGALMDRAERAARDNDLRLGCQLAQFAFRAAPTDSAITDRYVALFNQRRDSEWSLMSRGIFNGAAKAANTHRD